MGDRRGVGRLVAIAVAIQIAAPAAGAGQTLVADRLRLNTGPCVLRSSNGTPDKLVFSVCPVLTTEAATNLTLNPTGDLVLGPAGADILPDAGYSRNLGALNNKYLTLHAAELWVETLVAQNTIATIGGRVLVAPTTTLTADLAAAATSMTVKHNEMASGDRVYLEANGQVEFLAVTSGPSGSGPYTYSVTRNLDGSGANDWFAGDAVLNTGTTGDGFIDLYSVAGVLAGAGPTIVGNVRTGTTYNNLAARWAIGNLNGLFGYGATTYGAAFGDPSATNITIDATNGIRIRSGTTNKLVADTSGNLALTGDLSVGVSGVVRSSTATGFSTGDGFWLEGGSSPKFRIGNPSGNQLTYEASTGVLSLTGNGSGLTSIGPGSLTIGASRNLIRNSDCAVGTADWASGTTSAASVVFAAPGPSGKRLNDVADNTCAITFTGTPANTTVSFAYTNGGSNGLIPTIPGARYEASAYLGTVNATNAFVAIQWFGAAPTFTFLSQSDGSTCTTAAAGGTVLDNFCRSGLIATAPAGAYNGRLVVYETHSGAASPALYFVHTYFGQGLSGQTELSTWAPAGATEIIGGIIRTSTITADKLTVSSLSAISANIGTVTAGTMSGVTATFGGGAVTLNSSGLLITAGTGAANKIRWSDNAEISSNGSGSLIIRPTSGGSAGLYYSSGFQNVRVESGGVVIDPGTGGNTVNVVSLGGGGNRYVCVNNSGNLFASATACP